MVKNHKIIEKANESIDYILSTLKEFDDKATSNSDSLDFSSVFSSHETLDTVIEILKQTRDIENKSTKAHYMKDVVNFALEAYFNALHECEYSTDKE